MMKWQQSENSIQKKDIASKAERIAKLEKGLDRLEIKTMALSIEKKYMVDRKS